MAMVAAMGGVWRRLGFVKLGIFDFFFFLVVDLVWMDLEGYQVVRIA